MPKSKVVINGVEWNILVTSSYINMYKDPWKNYCSLKLGRETCGCPIHRGWDSGLDVAKVHIEPQDTYSFGDKAWN